jgi:hypothetical protein
MKGRQPIDSVHRPLIGDAVAGWEACGFAETGADRLSLLLRLRPRARSSRPSAKSSPGLSILGSPTTPAPSEGCDEEAGG